MLLDVGTAVLELTLTTLVVLQLFDGSVTVKLYVPLLVVVVVPLVGALPPGLQLYVTPEVDELPVRVAVAFVQVIVWLLPTLRPGSVVLVVTVSVRLFLHPFDGSVTVKV